MGKPQPLPPDRARRTIAHRLAPLIDRVRQIPTRLGIRSNRVFLVWTKYGGDERGDGNEVEVGRLEILPTPRVADLTSLALNPFTGGILPAGSVRVDRISARFNMDVLQGKVVPAAAVRGAPIKEPFDFFYEIVSDGRSDQPLQDSSEAERLSGGPSRAPRARFRLASFPERDEDSVQFSIILERISEDRTRDGESQIGADEVL